MSDISDIVLRIRVDIVNSAAILSLVNNMNKVDAANGRMRSSIDRTAKGASIWSKAFDKVVGHLSAVERKFDAVFRAGVHMQSMGRDLLGFAKSVGGAAKSLVDNWGEFQFTLNRAAAAADIFDTQSKLYDDLRQSVNKAAHELRVFPAEDVAKGLYFWQSTTGQTIKTQADLEKTMKNVTAVMKVAAMTDTSYEQAIKGVYSTLKQFNLGMDQTANVSALLFYATQKTALEFPDLINSLKMTGAVAGNAKEPLESMVAVLGAIGNAGIRGSQAGRALRQTYIKIVKPTAAAKKVLDDLFKSQGGYNKVAFDSKGNFIGIEKYVTKLSKAMKGLNYQQKANIIATITTANELPVMTQMIAAADRAGKNWVDTFADQKKAMDAFNGSWGNLESSWKGVIGGLKNSVGPIFQELGKSIADLLTPALNDLNVVIWDSVPAFSSMGKEIVESFKPIVTWVTDVIHKVIDWAKANPKLVKTLAKWGIIGAIFAGVAGAVLLAAGTFIFLLSNVVLIVAGMLPLIASLTAVGTVFGIVAVKIYQNVGNIQEIFKQFVPAFLRFINLFIFGTDGAAEGVSSLKDAIDKIATGAVKKFAQWLEKLTKYLNSLSAEDVANLKQIFKYGLLIIGLAKGFWLLVDAINAASGAYKGMKASAAAAKTAFSTTKDTVSAGASLIGGLLGALGKNIGVIASTIISAITGIVAAIGWPITAVIAIIAGLVIAYETNFLGFKDFVDGLVQWFIANVIPVIEDAITFLAPIIEQIVGAIGDFIGTVISVIQGLIDFFANLPQNIQNFIDQVVTNIQNFVSNLFTTIGNFLSDLANNWSYYLGYILGVIIAFPIRVLIEIVKFGVNLVSAIIDFLSKLPGMFADWFRAVFNFLSEWFGKAIGAVAKWAGEIIGGIIDWFVKLPGRILDLLGKVWSTLSTWFIDTAADVAEWAGKMVQGVIDFFKDLPANIVKAIKDFPGNLIQIFKNIAKAGSDFMKAIIGIGESILRGIWDGITNMVGWLTDKITGFFGGLVDGIKDTLGIKSPSRVMAVIGDQMIAGLAKGIAAADDAHKAMNSVVADLTKTAESASSAIGVSASGSLTSSTTTDSTKSIDLNVNVTSGDGSINSMDMSTLASLITGSDMTRALERMATVD